MSSHYAAALDAARKAAAGQNYPPGALYVVATPIGNLADITLRALHVLALADAVACEDTRHTQALLRAYGIDKSGAQLMAVHQHNEVQAAQEVIGRLRQGQRVACVSDAGTPAISDPGARLVGAVRAAGLAVVPLPGACSITTVLSVAGLAAGDEQKAGFVFLGFLPSKSGERALAVAALARQTQALVLLEAPHRIEALAAALAVLGERPLTVGRELTKQFEEITTLSAGTFGQWLGQAPNRCRGEFVLVLHPVAVPEHADAGAQQRLLRLLLAELPLKTAVRLAAEISGAPRNTLYEAALALKNQGDCAEPVPAGLSRTMP
ncbi:MAG: 16S rRNA (cytidine(1402)-2'-O)-methyltransferase [Rhodoferax sp.]|nr:16S rRNA (cytidine(1402)-2'-O)-methyltransferase [Rhodoferax sp.]